MRLMLSEHSLFINRPVTIYHDRKVVSGRIVRVYKQHLDFKPDHTKTTYKKIEREGLIIRYQKNYDEQRTDTKDSQEL